MVQGLIGKKIAMKQVFCEDGTVVPATVIQAGPCVVIQRKTSEREGYSAAQLAFVEGRPPKKVNKPYGGHFKRANLPPARRLHEFRVVEGSEVKEGDSVLVTMFVKDEMVHITGISKGKGFAGVVKRHHFHGGAGTHGSMFHRAPGSIGSSAYPSRVLKGMRAAGHMGDHRMTVRNLQVLQVEPDSHLLVVKGAVPGRKGGYVFIRRAGK